MGRTLQHKGLTKHYEHKMPNDPEPLQYLFLNVRKRYDSFFKM